MSKGLEALELIKIYKLYSKGSNTPQYIDLQKCFPEEWEIIEKSLKALEIIKEKEIDTALFKECPNIDEYNNWCSNKAKLTQDEYDLLKEVLL